MTGGEKSERKNDRNNLPYTHARAATSARGEDIFEIPACTRVRYPGHRGSYIYTRIYYVCTHAYTYRYASIYGHLQCVYLYVGIY